MQIIIIGAGIAGLSSYIFLTKHLLDSKNPDSHTIRIFERYDIRQTKDDSSSSSSSSTPNSPGEATIAFKTIGGAIGIGKNGLAVLGRMDETGSVLEQLKQRGNCISKWKMGTARGFKIVDAVVESSSGKDIQGPVQPTVMIARQAAWEVLRDRVLESNPEAVTTAKVVKICPTQGGKVTVVLEDGSECVADLVIGADGLKSAVRRTMFEHTEDTEPQSWWERLIGRTPRAKDYITPQYEGLTGIGGIVPSHVLKQAGFEPGAMSITFGPNGFFGHGYLSPTAEINSPTTKDTALATWWSTFSSPTPTPFQQNTPKNSDTENTKSTIDKEAVLQHLNARHRTWQDPVIQAILEHVTKTRAVDQIWPTYTTPELPTWHTSNLVLIGDAAHTLQPSSAQGACQALEDSECLALLLSRCLSASEGKQDNAKAITSALNTFDNLRKPRLAKIYAASQKMGKNKSDMNVVQEFLMYFFIWLGNASGMWKKYNDEIFEYDVPREVERAVAAKKG